MKMIKLKIKIHLKRNWIVILKVISKVAFRLIFKTKKWLYMVTLLKLKIFVEYFKIVKLEKFNS